MIPNMGWGMKDSLRIVSTWEIMSMESLRALGSTSGPTGRPTRGSGPTGSSMGLESGRASREIIIRGSFGLARLTDKGNTCGSMGISTLASFKTVLSMASGKSGFQMETTTLAGI